MADLVPIRLRGRYFGMRSTVMGLISLAFTFIAGGILQSLSARPFVGFAILFGGAALFRLLSLYFLAKMHEPPQSNDRKEDTAGLLATIRGMASSNLGRFTIYVACINFGTNLASPFFSVHMLRDLHFNYVTYTILVSCVSISSLIFLTYWGRRADIAGNIKIVRITSCFLPVVPLLWLASTNPYYLAFAEIFSGFAWSGFNLATVNFVYDASEEKDRTKHIAIYNTFTSLAICLGAIIGGYIATYLPELLGYQLRTLFTISGISRAIVVIFLLRTIKEVRNVPPIPVSHLLMVNPPRFHWRRKPRD
ncbi:MAG: MFS transporter [Dehalococcoidales bacterium]|nr:MFS transporter [Dehalococcoidales bacterium]